MVDGPDAVLADVFAEELLGNDSQLILRRDVSKGDFPHPDEPLQIVNSNAVCLVVELPF